MNALKTLRNVAAVTVLGIATLTAGSFATASSAAAFPIHGGGHGGGHGGHGGHGPWGGWGHGGWGHGGFGGIYVTIPSYVTTGDDCYYVKKVSFIPGYGYAKKKVLVCE